MGRKKHTGMNDKNKIVKIQSDAHNCMELKDKIVLPIKGFLYEYSYY